MGMRNPLEDLYKAPRVTYLELWLKKTKKGTFDIQSWAHGSGSQEIE